MASVSTRASSITAMTAICSGLSDSAEIGVLVSTRCAALCAAAARYSSTPGDTLEVVIRIRQMQQIALNITVCSLLASQSPPMWDAEKNRAPTSARRYILMRRCTSTNSVPLRSFCRTAFDSFELQAEIFDLFFVVGTVRMRAPHRPAPQSAQRQLGKQHIQLVQHRSHTAGRAGYQRVDELQIIQEQVGHRPDVAPRWSKWPGSIRSPNPKSWKSGSSPSVPDRR